MQFESLKAFCDLVATRSFTQTARLNNVSQSSISQTISALERQFQSLLIERSRKNFRLTPEGEVFYSHSREILQAYAAIHSRLQEIKHVISGEIRLATVYSLGLHDLPPYLKHFLKEYPDVKVRVEYRRANRVYDDVLGNIVDLGLVAYPGHHPKLGIIPLRKEPLVLTCHPQHPLAKHKRIRLKALNGVKIVSFEPDMPTRKALDTIFKDRGVKVEHVMEFDNIETVKRAVEVDCGVAIVPEPSVRQEVANQTLAAVGLEGNYFRPLAAIHRKTKVLSPAIKQFLALLKKPL
jgi:DNA-binding transcriptional LysR family regulator